MIEELKDEELVNKVGGRFKLTTLIQKRLAVLNRGSQAYVDDPTGESDNLQIVVREILENKIQLREDGELIGGDDPLDFSTPIQ